ncbi:pilus (MSHA type) biogenesis protein MshL [Vibrio sp. S17_S38]|uniref:pilus (MSHA type) biogenesis protein MshL n=1 Tax=Vibrio sp. S17_S38 TaxID=2720229 RepID=UPI001680BB40|nr:pilus (MSHA type) biogenesis protein MshL [Vibrio sp. S17_S38]MBD1574512.1 pilus (MSHA type) biogenesis protein MshL [Vibrio sp. S17_S38]
MRKIIISIMMVSLMGCSMGHRDPVEIKQALNEAVNDNNSSSIDDLPDSVQADLMPDIEGVKGKSKPVKRFRVQAQNVDAKAFFASLVQGTDYSTIIHPDVSGKITLNLSDVTLDEVLNSVRDIYGYDIAKSGKVIQIYPAGLRTETIPVDYLQFKRKGLSLTTITTGSVTSEYDDNNNSSSNSSSNSGSNSNNGNGSSSSETNSTGGTRIETTSESDFWPQLQKAVKAMVGNDGGRSVIVSPQASVITVRAYPNELREIHKFLGISAKRMHRQVILEAKIMEVTLSDGYQQGINWSNLGGSIGGTTISGGTSGGGSIPGLNTIGDLLGGGTNVVVSDGNFSAVMNFMATQGDLNVLSSPRVTAANNQKAVIKVGQDRYFVTGVDGEISGGDNSIASQNVDLTPFFSGISLDVTPQIDDKGNVMLHVHPAVIEVETDNQEIDLGNDQVLNLPLARSSIRESDSVVRAKDGDVVVIGGLMKTSTLEQTTKVPLLGDIPGLGWLFRNTNQITQKTELVILLKPTVVGVNTWSQEVEKSRDLLQEWFPDSK